MSAVVKDLVSVVLVNRNCGELVDLVFPTLVSQTYRPLEIIVADNASGDGSLERPYQVARVADEYALLRHLKKSWDRQTMLQRDGRVVDALECSDGASLHFQLPQADLLTGRALA